jgi:hypothetical protein
VPDAVVLAACVPAVEVVPATSTPGAAAASWTLSRGCVTEYVVVLAFIRPRIGKKLRMLAERIAERMVRCRFLFALAAIAFL